MTCQDDTVPRSYKRSMVQSHTYQSVQHLTVALPLIFRREGVDVADLRPRDGDHLRSGCVPDSVHSIQVMRHAKCCLIPQVHTSGVRILQKHMLRTVQLHGT